ncbi:MAG: helix-turn-helix transcriptional regulator [Lachnospiraceae bacterium]|nr:helix-turn-helix transcriptional regulator [Lachnospiraceae bacterium]
MKLYTECFWDDWDRIVDIYVEKNDRFPEYINDETTYKIVVVEKGTLSLKMDGRDYVAKAPALILLSNKDKADFKIMEKIRVDIVFFNPTAVRDEFSFERIDAHDFDNKFGTIIYQDYVMILPFTKAEIIKPVIPISLNSLERVKNIIGSLDAQLKGQKDGFWPCRSRSFLMELLYFINYSYVIVSAGDDQEKNTETSVSFSEIVEYLNEHIGDSINLERLTKEFLINRNKLNDIFMKESSMTCMNYLLKLRLDLAKVLLSTTQIPIGEVSARVGFDDQNYFAKVFKKHEGMSPKAFRNQ